MRKIDKFVYFLFFVFYVIGGNLVATGQTIPGTHVLYLPLLSQYYVGTMPSELVLDQEDVGAAFLMTASGTDTQATYHYAYSEWDNQGEKITNDVFLFFDPTDAETDYADTVAFYRDDPALTEQPSPAVGDQAALFKGEGEQHLLIFIKANVVVVVGTQNLDGVATTNLAIVVAGKI